MNNNQQGTVANADRNATKPTSKACSSWRTQERALTFCLVSSLFLLWGLQRMIDVMDKMFQEQLHLSLSQSAWVQFAHWMGYFLMSMPAGWLATRLGYKGGIIAGLAPGRGGRLLVYPRLQHRAFWAFLLGVCVVASGLTFLETVANPYTTVLGHPVTAARASTPPNRAMVSGGFLDRLPPACSSMARTPRATARGHRRYGFPSGRGGGSPDSGRHFLLRSCP